jgi:hypothetical protein
MDSPAGSYCRECYPGVGCKIWENVPENCKKYKCLYNQFNIDIKYRPDYCGIVFEKATETIIYGTIDDDVITLSEDANEMIGIFLSKGFSVVLRSLETEPFFIFEADGRTAHEVFKEIKEAAWRHQAILQTYRT